MKLQRQHDSRTTEQAAEWLERLDGATPQESAAFIEWLKESPRHVGEFLAVGAISREFEGVDARRRIDIDALLAQARSNVVRLDEPGKPAAAARVLSRRLRGPAAAVAIAATMAIAVGITWSLWGNLGGERFETAIGEQRSVELPDGSLVFLNTHSKLMVNFSARARDLQLLSGEALFKVARDAKRPFRVDVGTAIVQAVGTQFNVYRRAEATTVSVLEGRIKVADKHADGVPGESSASLIGGQQANIDSDGHISPRAAVSSVNVTAWRQRQLMFRSDRLADVAAEFNRYNQSPRIRVEGAEARERRLTGIFDADDPESLVLFLANSDLQVRQEEGAVVIEPRRP